MPALTTLLEYLSQQEAKANAGEAQLPFDVLRHMVQVTVKARPDVGKNSFGLVDLFIEDFTSHLSAISDLLMDNCD